MPTAAMEAVSCQMHVHRLIKLEAPGFSNVSQRPTSRLNLHSLSLCPCGTPARNSTSIPGSVRKSKPSARSPLHTLHSTFKGFPVTASTSTHFLSGHSVKTARLFGRPGHGSKEKGLENPGGKKGVVTCAQAIDVINSLGLDTLTFLAATVLIIPAFKSIKVSPVIGFLGAGVVLNQLGWFRNVEDIERLAELGILFLLFEMGLELSIERLRALAKFAFGMGLAQVLLCSLTFTFFELPINNALGTRILTTVLHSKPDLVNIRSLDEAIVIGAALSLSSSAFVLQLLAEKGELPTRFGSATLGVLLMQDIAVVPLLVILPILESGKLSGDPSVLWATLGITTLKALGGLGLLLLGGRLLLRRVFETVAASRSTEAFIALSLLTATGTSYLTQKLGFSDSLGAFLAGALLSETNYRTQIEADIKPFRGLLIGLFFVTTGTSIDLKLIATNWPDIMALLVGMLAVKTGIVTGLAPRFGLTLAESVRTGLLLSQGGEFAFVVLALANRLGVLPSNLNRLLIIVVVLSMALTPLLNELGRVLAAKIDEVTEVKEVDADAQLQIAEAVEPIVIIGFGQLGQVLANFLSSPLSSAEGSSQSKGWPYVAFDLDPKRVKAARSLGFPVIYGDASRPQVLSSAGIPKPKAIMVMYTGRQRAVQAVQSLSEIYKDVPIYARAQDLSHLLELKFAGATEVVPENTETSLRLGSRLLVDLGMRKDDVTFVRNSLRESMEFQAQEWGAKGGEPAESQLVIVAPPKLERGPRRRAPTGDASLVSAGALLKGEGQESTLVINRDLEKGLGGPKESGEIPLQGGVALASWRESQEGVLLSQEIALRQQLEDLKMEQVKLRFGFGFEQGPYCLVPSKEKRVKDEVSKAEGKQTADAAAPAVAPPALAADVSKPATPAVSVPGAEAGENGARGSLAGQVASSAGDDVSTPAGSSESGEEVSLGSDGAAVPVPTADEPGASASSTNGATPDGASVSASGQENGAERPGSDDSLWAWASSKVSSSSVSGLVSKMQERGPTIDDDLGSIKEEDSVWSWASSRLGQRPAVVEAKEASIDDDLGSGAGIEEDTIWSWATRNRSGIDSEGFLRASVSWDPPSRGSATDVVQRIPLKDLTRWVGRKKGSEGSEGDEGSGGSSDLNPVGELEDCYDDFSDGEEFSGYMTVEEDPNREGDDLEGEIEWGVWKRLNPFAQDGRQTQSAKEKGPKQTQRGQLDTRVGKRRAKAAERNLDVEQMQAEMDGRSVDIENDKQQMHDVASEFRGSEYEPSADMEAHVLQDDGVVVEDADAASVAPVAASKK